MTEISKNTELQQSCIATVKSRFFAQYLNLRKSIHRQGFHLRDNINPNGVDEHDILQLKPLSKITDEDAIDLLKIFSENIEFSESQLKDFKDDIIDIYDNKIDDYISSSDIRSIFNGFDFLRSKGYAVPFMEYLVDDLVSFGWVQLL